MTSIVQRLVSGNKARFKDKELNLELDLVYLTDQLIIMGFPAEGIEAYYRNPRTDAQKFLSTRHGSDFWVFNFCPVAENSYDKSVFGGRVSRYPFPDHHAPPLALLPLAADEIRRWIQGSPKRVAVLHCKAGKGRSGTLACASLLSLETIPGKPQPSRAQVSARADELIEAMPADEEEGERELLREDTPNPSDSTLSAQSQTPSRSPDNPTGKDSTSGDAKNDFTQSTKPDEGAKEDDGKTEAEVAAGVTVVKNILDLHTSKRMKPNISKQGVSIPSQRRWLHYYARVLSNEAPPGFWPWKSSPDLTPQSTPDIPTSAKQTVRVKKITLALRASAFTRAANTLLKARAPKIWAVLARYDDDLVGELEEACSKTFQAQTQNQVDHIERVFTEEPKWDAGRMVWRFARFRAGVGVEKKGHLIEGKDKSGKEGTDKDTAMIYELVPDGSFVSEITGDVVRKSERKGLTSAYSDAEADQPETSDSDSGGVLGGLAGRIGKGKKKVGVDVGAGIPVDPNRELRVKLFMGRVPLGWLWIIPAFHREGREGEGKEEVKIKLDGGDVDFAFGVGGDILSVEICLEFS